MRRRLEVGLVYLAGLIQGLALVTYAATSAVLTDAEYHQLSSSEYGSLFIPMIVAAVLASLASGPLARRWTPKRVYLLGLGADVLAMAAYAGSALLIPGPVYITLFAAMTLLGFGFGFTVSTINVFVAGFFPERADTALTALHALLGTGTALAPLIGAVLLAPEHWWALPAGVAAGAALVLALSVAQPLEARAAESATVEGGVPGLLWVFAAAALLYGVAESLFANWATLYVSETEGLSPETGGLVLATFWAMVTAGRILAAILSRWIQARWIYRVLPVLIAVAFVAVPLLGGAAGNVIAFGLGGLACSAFLPLSIGFGTETHPDLAELVSGGLMAAYLLGFGIAAFAPGPLRDGLGLSLSTIYGSAAAVGVLLALIAFWIVARAGEAEAEPATERGRR